MIIAFTLYAIIAAFMSILLLATSAYSADRIVVIAATWPVWLSVAIVAAFAWFFFSGWQSSAK